MDCVIDNSASIYPMKLVKDEGVFPAASTTIKLRGAVVPVVTHRLRGCAVARSGSSAQATRSSLANAVDCNER